MIVALLDAAIVSLLVLKDTQIAVDDGQDLSENCGHEDNDECSSISWRVLLNEDAIENIADQLEMLEPLGSTLTEARRCYPGNSQQTIQPNIQSSWCSRRNWQ